MNKELKDLLDNYEKTIYGQAFPIVPSTHQLHLLLDYIANLDQQVKKQKEFIEWLENENRKIYRDCGLRQNIFKQVLQKYEEIIGVSDENNKQ